MIRKISTLVKSLECKEKLIVLGSNHEIMQSELKGIEIPIIINQDWRLGISSSIKISVKNLARFDNLDGILFLVCDQPFLNKLIIESILTKFQNTSRYIVASKYQNAVGTPAVFHHSFFIELLNLTGDKGAGKIINENLDKTALVEFEEGIIDIDTKEEYDLYMKR